MSSLPTVNEPVDDIYSLSAKITSQQSLVRQLKKDSADALLIAQEVSFQTLTHSLT